MMMCARALIAGNDVVLSPRNLKKEIDGVMSALKKVVCRKLILTGNAGKYCHLNMRWDFLLGKKWKKKDLQKNW